MSDAHSRTSLSGEYCLDPHPSPQPVWEPLRAGLLGSSLSQQQALPSTTGLQVGLIRKWCASFRLHLGSARKAFVFPTRLFLKTKALRFNNKDTFL